MARVNSVVSLATKHDVNTRPASFWWREASSDSSSSWLVEFPEMFLNGIYGEITARTAMKGIFSDELIGFST